MEKNYASSQHATRLTQNNPDSGFWKLYPKSDGFYQLDSLGNEIKIVSAVSVNTTNYIPKSNGSIFVDSQITDNGSSVVVGTNITLDGLDTGNYPISIRSSRNDLTRMQLINQGTTQTDLEISINGGANSIYYGVNTNGNSFIDNRTGNLLFQNTGTTQMIFDNSGRLGIGATAPSATIHIQGINATSSNHSLKVDNLALSPLLYVRNDGYSSFNGISNSIGSVESHGVNLHGFVSVVNGVDNIYAGLGVTDGATWFFRVNKSGEMQVNSSQNSFFIGGGNVGIGTSTPTKKLAVNGDALINGLTVGKGVNGISTNVVFGVNSLLNATGVNNVGVGTNTLKENTSGANNTAIGHDVLSNNLTGDDNLAIGSQALIANTTGFRNTALGAYALLKNTTGIQNVAIGTQTMLENTTGNDNVAIGWYCLRANVVGERNVAIGRNALEVSTGSFNVGVGYRAGANITTGEYNTAVGNDTMAQVSTGSFNTFIGRDTGRAVTTGSANTIIGASVIGLANGITQNVILADGYGNIRFHALSNGNVGLGTSSPTSKLQVVGLLEYTDNADALANGLTIGAFYRTGDLLKVVH